MRNFLAYCVSTILCLILTSCKSYGNANSPKNDTAYDEGSIEHAGKAFSENSNDGSTNNEIIFTDFYDYDNDGFDEKIFFLNNDFSANPEIISAWYSDEVSETNFAEIEVYGEMLKNNKSDIFSSFDLNEQHFVSVHTSIAMGWGVPTSCYTVTENTPVCVSDNTQFNMEYGEGYDRTCFTAFVVLNNTPYVRESGPAAGVNNLHPLYWDGEEFKIYETTLSDMRFVEKADIKNLVSDIGRVKNVLIRNNGLLHINYYNDSGNVNSKTYVLKNNIITDEYKGIEAGLYQECMEVSDSDLSIVLEEIKRRYNAE